MMKRSFLLLTICLFFIPSISFASLLPGGPESLDTSFNQIGFKLVQQGSDTLQELTCVAVQPDNKTVYAGFNYYGYAYYVGIVMRLNENGSLDTTFNPTGIGSLIPGIAIFELSTNVYFYDIALQPDGKIVVCGSAFNGTNSDGLIVRYTADGLLDTATFGNTLGYTVNRFSQLGAEYYGMTLQPDGSIVTVGYVGVTYTESPCTQANLLTASPVVARYTSAGILDTTFNGTGYNINTAINSTIIHTNSIAVACHTGVVIEPIDGNILITGTGITSLYWPINVHTLPIPELGNMYLTSYTSAGILAQTAVFPYALSAYGSNNYLTCAFRIALQLDGKAIIVGNSTTGNAALLYMCTRLLTTPASFGLPDPTFNETGYNIFTGTNTWSSAFGVAMQENQQIVTGGTSYAANFVSNLMITRFNQDGTIDPSCSFEFETGDEMYCYDVAVDLNGKIIGAGYLYTRDSTEQWDLAAIRFIGGQTPEPGPTIAIDLYGYNPVFLSEFLYVSTYAQTIIDPIAQAAAITAVNDLVDAYILAYDHQPLVQSNFNFITYLYLMKTGLLAAQVILIANYAGSTTEINQFFDYLFERIEILAA